MLNPLIRSHRPWFLAFDIVGSGIPATVRSVVTSVADVRRDSVQIGNRLSRLSMDTGKELARRIWHEDSPSSQRDPQWLTDVFAYTALGAGTVGAVVPQAATKFMPYMNPYSAVAFGSIDVYNLSRHGVEYLWE